MRKLFMLVLTLGMVVAACAGSSTDTTTTGDAGDDAPVTTAAAPVDTTTSAVETTTTTAAAGTTAGGGPDCVVGTWVLDTDAFVENFAEIFAQAGMPDTDVTALGGSFTVELSADGALSATREGWGFSMITPESTVALEINGTETGTWSADGTTLTVNTDTSDLQVNSSIEVDGQLIEVPEGQLPIETPSGIASSSDYTCSGDVLTLSNAGVESVLNRS